MKIDTDEKKIDELLSRGVIVQTLPTQDEFKKRLLFGEQLRIYIGADPTSDALHLSHAKNYMLLEEFRKLGHKTIVLFGDFTAKIGDPTDKESVRQQLSSDEIKTNVKGWIKQLSSILDFKD